MKCVKQIFNIFKDFHESIFRFFRVFYTRFFHVFMKRRVMYLWFWEGLVSGFLRTIINFPLYAKKFCEFELLKQLRSFATGCENLRCFHTLRDANFRVNFEFLSIIFRVSSSKLERLYTISMLSKL